MIFLLILLLLIELITSQKYFSNHFLESKDRITDFTVATINEGFVVVMKRAGDYNKSIVGQFYTIDGEMNGEEFVIHETASEIDHQNPSVTSVQGNSFLVVWEEEVAADEYYYVFGKIFSSEGIALTEVFRINKENPQNNYHIKAVKLTNSDYFVCWDGPDQNERGVYGRLISPEGSLKTDQIQINTHNSSFQDDCHLDVLKNGNIVVVWESLDQDIEENGVYGQIFTPEAEKVGEEFQIHTNQTQNQNAPFVSGLNNGNFVVVWESTHDGGDHEGFGQIFDENGNKIGNQFKINEVKKDSFYSDFLPVATYDGFAVVWEDDENFIRAQYFFEDGSKSGTELVLSNTSVKKDYQNPRASILNSNELVVVWSRGELSNSFDGVILPNNNRCFVYCPSEREVFSPNICECASIDSVPYGKEFTYIVDFPNLDEDLHVRISTINEDFVVVFKLYDDESANFTILGQFYNRNGETKGEKFEIASSSKEVQDPELTSTQEDSFLVVYEKMVNIEGQVSKDVFGRIFSTSGEPIGEEYQINQNILKNNITSREDQDDIFPAYIGKSEGYIVVYEGSGDQDGSDTGIFGRLLTSEGVPKSDEFQVNTFNISEQDDCSVSVLKNKNFVVVWESSEQDEDGVGVYGQMYSPEGKRIGQEFLLHRSGNYSQDDVTIAPLDNGGFVTVWEQGSGFLPSTENFPSIGFGQIYDENGNKIYDEFKITNPNNPNYQYDFLVTPTYKGFFVTWEDSELEQIYGQYFNEKGEKIGTEIHLNFNLGQGGRNPRATTLPTNEIAIVWESYQKGSNFGQTYDGIILPNINSCFKYCKNQTLDGKELIFDENSCSCVEEAEESNNFWVTIVVFSILAGISICIIAVIVLVIILIVGFAVLQNKFENKKGLQNDIEMI